MEVVRRRMQTLAAEGISQKGVMGFRQAVLDIWAKEKLRGFYAGMLPNTIQVQRSSFPSSVPSCVHDLLAICTAHSSCRSFIFMPKSLAARVATMEKHGAQQLVKSCHLDKYFLGSLLHAAALRLECWDRRVK